MTLRRSSRLNASKVLVVVLSLVCVLVSPKTLGTELKARSCAPDSLRGEIARPNIFLQIDALPETQEPEVRSRLLKGEIFIQSMATKEDGSPVEVRGIVHSERLPDHA